jgi:hypothetical protein
MTGCACFSLDAHDAGNHGYFDKAAECEHLTQASDTGGWG